MRIKWRHRKTQILKQNQIKNSSLKTRRIYIQGAGIKACVRSYLLHSVVSPRHILLQGIALTRVAFPILYKLVHFHHARAVIIFRNYRQEIPYSFANRIIVVGDVPNTWRWEEPKNLDGASIASILCFKRIENWQNDLAW